MARIDHKDLFNIRRTANFFHGKRVGHNRTLYRDQHHLVYRLHGYAIARLDADGDRVHLTLDNRAYRTATTRQAMADFLSAAGIPGNVSFAGGKFSARIDGTGYVTDGYIIEHSFDPDRAYALGLAD